eukprot:CAMPEP_0113528006 /NCGR_PEP_ID=MMETSP0015_2-20120614/1602_1 /TAXON_ID=2838 /ORGANISM="Odontella" /LENGTH=396 /DNA_ID=CAMNT_0000426485 /DNA_START=174 /DNA_END=1364 /DNA_ORIENTATION=+ /assembly_acc=CAM_ASM_000160
MRASVPAILAVLLLLSNDSATGAVTAPLSPLCGTRRRKRITPSLAARSVRGGGRLAAAAIDNAEGTPRHGKKGAVVTTAPLKPSSSATVDGLKNALASGLAAACSKAILQPFDTLKTVQQQTRSVGGERGLGLAEAVRKITAREGGVRNLYSGLVVSALGSMPSVGLYFGVYSYSKKKLIPFFREALGSGRDGTPVLSDTALRSIAIVCSAAVGNTIASSFRVPYEVVKQNIQTGKYSSTLGAVRSMYAGTGIRAFFPLGGVGVQMARDIPYAMFTLLAYEAIRDHWVSDNPGPLRDMAAGALSGGWGSFVTNPLDVIKTRLQTDGPGAGLYGGSIIKCAVATYEEGGPMTFLRGAAPRLMHKIPANGCFFVFYEFFRRMLRVEGAVAKGSDTKTR